MTRIVVDGATIAKLGNLSAFVEICDESGKLLGHFAPVAGEQIYKGITVPEISQEEWERRMNEPTRPTEDVLRDLEQRS